MDLLKVSFTHYVVSKKTDQGPVEHRKFDNRADALKDLEERSRCGDHIQCWKYVETQTLIGRT